MTLAVWIILAMLVITMVWLDKTISQVFILERKQKILEQEINQIKINITKSLTCGYNSKGEYVKK